uniref:Uncharacterized protein n=1 Tax=Arundo donax TaxID=35708 RepID=A0A0A8Z8B6_ARUDO
MSSPTVAPLAVGFWPIHPKFLYMIFKLLSLGFESQSTISLSFTIYLLCNIFE